MIIVCMKKCNKRREEIDSEKEAVMLKAQEPLPVGLYITGKDK